LKLHLRNVSNILDCNFNVDVFCILGPSRIIPLLFSSIPFIFELSIKIPQHFLGKVFQFVFRLVLVFKIFAEFKLICSLLAAVLAIPRAFLTL